MKDLEETQKELLERSLKTDGGIPHEFVGGIYQGTPVEIL